MNREKIADVGLLVLRIFLAVAMMYHGSQKLFGAFGGPGLEATIGGFQASRGIPPLFGYLAVIAEFFGGLGVGVGLATRLAAFGIACTMAVATYVHVSSGDPFMKFELPLMLFGMAVAVMLTGAGSFSLDKAFFGKRGKK
jgi:putative oxidoreductase